MADDFDIEQAERVQINAASVLGPGKGPDRLQQFPIVTEWLGKSITEVKRLKVGRVALVAEALNELNGLMLTQLDDAMNRRGSLVEAVKEFRERNYYLQRNSEGQWRWTPRPESDIHAALERLASAAQEAERSIHN